MPEQTRSGSPEPISSLPIAHEPRREDTFPCRVSTRQGGPSAQLLIDWRGSGALANFV